MSPPRLDAPDLSPHALAVCSPLAMRQVSFLDDSLGFIVQELHDAHMYERTLLVLSSDNGGPIKQSIPGNTDAIGAACLDSGIRITLRR